MSSTTIRFARVEDCPVIFEMILGLAEYEKSSHEVVGSVEKLEEKLFKSPRYAEVLLAETEGQVVGFALFFHTFSTFLCLPGLYLEDLFVLPDFRGRGIGLALISALGKVGVERGCGRVEWSVLDWNEPAISFYTSLGARGRDEWTGMRVAGTGLSNLAEASPICIENSPHERS